MHRSRLSTVVIDCADTDSDRGFEFWSQALGREKLHAGNEDDARYASLKGRVGGDGGPIVLLQRVAAPERAIHLDIETDDVAAEVARLEKLGAQVKARIRNHVVMVAPSGHPFCVVPVHRPDFPARAKEWS
jgi:predicted enzyme related to lactoylglutathione lyase